MTETPTPKENEIATTIELYFAGVFTRNETWKKLEDLGLERERILKELGREEDED